MASSNRHWPSMFKSKPNHQWQHDINSSLISSSGCHRYSSSGQGCEERTPEPKPRWNPRPEQIRILESIFNSGIINPPREEIRRIRAQLQEYGQVGDANVFYWFQNRKSRSKHKLRQQLQSPKSHHATASAPPNSSSSSSSSSDKSSPNSSNLSAGPAAVIDLLNSPTASVNQQQPFAAATEFLPENFFFPAQQSPGFCFSDHVSGGGAAEDQGVGSCQNFLLSELMLMSNCPSKKITEDDEKMKLAEQHLSYDATAVSDPAHHFLPPPPPPSNFPINQLLQGLGECAGPTERSSTVFINDVCLEVGVGPFNVREAFGDDVVLMQSTGQPVLTNGWGVTLHPLQHGAFYYLMRPFTSSHDLK